ncbi:MAG: hypothetical protein A2268_02995 [Candidatus Raymondbacteria bacterium RifOxyA12_full_50_37]|uniref:Uncharacterized protein n=1 Tax=Candidatus Raymondbacteria bacterium RIFOXYD12_FULL_49_13 TaxID=1817890 RepID=A0A1F7F9B1_UNCRA|nr:MAG: hypothetical protein A2248_17100 [Candidatus Raymondbacteria bacterium RIFOXYA2_FULL_49_16]OGJ90744.1 MAG: hypothetical protein A2268_02995 [Candidatus Raymondbacteria bacterium RifOxyA12_full_50_37]OGJ98381.1 MAG: hypothetical protein A2453_09005 [Candidatus Raymondbacteria bacterium RIFOXYC2_FULL_50_21]OGK03106.1 MAG: hypothetical protein A2519_06835 [Candidatus Raymondbacteria bacterium RIFOXYD12_FULL_49_13]OGK06609.1 MAG: hypothetical protein A2487_03045 [Candidatus Raymondbacteria 
MPQNVKICAGYSDKISENYNSTQFSLSLEMDCQINGSTREIEDASARLFSLCKQIVNRQKNVSVDNLLSNAHPVEGNGKETPIPSQPAATEPQKPEQPAPASEPQKSEEAISDKQVKYIFGLGRDLGKSGKDVRDLITTRFNKPVDALSKTEASLMIKELKQAA